jgi:hypothetical protein
MKRLFFVMMAVLFLAGCGAAARESGFYQHNSVYKNWDHMKFSIFGHREVSAKEAKESNEQDWWGIPEK